MNIVLPLLYYSMTSLLLYSTGYCLTAVWEVSSRGIRSSSIYEKLINQSIHHSQRRYFELVALHIYYEYVLKHPRNDGQMNDNNPEYLIQNSCMRSTTILPINLNKGIWRWNKGSE